MNIGHPWLDFRKSHIRNGTAPAWDSTRAPLFCGSVFSDCRSRTTMTLAHKHQVLMCICALSLVVDCVYLEPCNNPQCANCQTKYVCVCVQLSLVKREAHTQMLHGDDMMHCVLPTECCCTNVATVNYAEYCSPVTHKQTRCGSIVYRYMFL